MVDFHNGSFCIVVQFYRKTNADHEKLHLKVSLPMTSADLRGHSKMFFFKSRFWKCILGC